MVKTLSVVGSTGSIGTQTLRVCDSLGVKVVALSGNKNVALMEKQVRQYSPELVAMSDTKAARALKTAIADTKTVVTDDMCRVAQAEADMCLVSVVGIAGLKATLSAAQAGRIIALANKESLVCAGELVMRSAKILPVDSEHSAIFQCLQGGRANLRRIILTASGGPFFGMKDFDSVTPARALKHPNWSMGAKITVDCATLMNKGLEFIEAMHLFSLTPDEISIIVHPESVIHSMIEYRDGALIAQLGTPDMRLPIAYCLTYPERRDFGGESLNLLGKSLTFAEPDYEAFPCLSLALAAAKTAKTAGAVLNGANEQAVGLFLDGKIAFAQIAEAVEYAMSNVKPVSLTGVEDVYAADAAARECVISKFLR